MASEPGPPDGPGFDYHGALVVIETGAGEIVFIHPPAARLTPGRHCRATRASPVRHRRTRRYG